MYGAGPFAHEYVPVPVPRVISDAEEPQTIHDTSISLKGNATQAVLVPQDFTIFGQAAIQHSSWIPAGKNFHFMAGAAASAWVGETFINGDEYDVAAAGGLLPGNWLFYGASGQASLGLRAGSRLAYRCIFHGNISYETGPWAEARRDLADIIIEEDPEDPYDADSTPFINLSPSPWSGSIIVESGMEYMITDSTFFMASIDVGYGTPDLEYPVFANLLLGSQVQLRFSDVTFYTTYRYYYLMNQSVNVGIIYSF
jgi:hypothetical protein